MTHINRYRRHRDEVQKRGGRIDHSQILKKSDNPQFIGEDDMLLMTREESGRHFGRLEDPLEEQDDIYADDDDDLDMLMLPQWAKDVPLNKFEAPFTATRLSSPAVPICRPLLQAYSSPSHVSLPAPSQFTSSLAPTPSVGLIPNTFYSHANLSTSQPLTTICLQDLVPSVSSSQQLMSNLGQFRPVSSKPMTTEVATPVLDEKESTGFEDILPDLLKAASDTDPLMAEIHQESKLGKRSSEEEGGATKKARGNDQTSTSCPNSLNFTPLVTAIEKATHSIVEAMDRNSRAIRCHDKTLSELVSGVRRIERILEAQSDKRRSPFRESRRDSKENIKPSVKSTVNRVTDKK